MNSTKGPTWYPGAEPGVVGYFEQVGIPDVPASEAADELREMPCVVLIAKPVGATDWTPVKVKPHNMQELIRRFPDAWRAFQGEHVDVGGTPLTELGMSGSDIEALRLNGITSVETMAELSDERAQALGFGKRKQRDAARAYIAAKRDRPVREQVNEALAAALAARPTPVPGIVWEQPSPAASAPPPQAKRRGRPRKAKVEAA